jgi:hypothetical protein
MDKFNTLNASNDDNIIKFPLNNKMKRIQCITKVIAIAFYFALGFILYVSIWGLMNG